jgi:predicted phage tail protein
MPLRVITTLGRATVAAVVENMAVAAVEIVPVKAHAKSFIMVQTRVRAIVLVLQNARLKLYL